MYPNVTDLQARSVTTVVRLSHLEVDLQPTSGDVEASEKQQVRKKPDELGNQQS